MASATIWPSSRPVRSAITRRHRPSRPSRASAPAGAPSRRRARRRRRRRAPRRARRHPRSRFCPRGRARAASDARLAGVASRRTTTSLPSRSAADADVERPGLRIGEREERGHDHFPQRDPGDLRVARVRVGRALDPAQHPVVADETRKLRQRVHRRPSWPDRRPAAIRSARCRRPPRPACAARTAAPPRRASRVRRRHR